LKVKKIHIYTHHTYGGEGKLEANSGIFLGADCFETGDEHIDITSILYEL
jgi:hypothetical protein